MDPAHNTLIGLLQALTAEDGCVFKVKDNLPLTIADVQLQLLAGVVAVASSHLEFNLNCSTKRFHTLVVAVYVFQFATCVIMLPGTLPCWIVKMLVLVFSVLLSIFLGCNLHFEERAKMAHQAGVDADEAAIVAKILAFLEYVAPTE